MADSILNHLSAKNIFDLEGIVAVVTGGGSVSLASGCDVSILTSFWGDRALG